MPSTQTQELIFTWDARDLSFWRTGKIDAAVVRALSKAGGDAARAMKAASSRCVRQRKKLKVAKVNKALPLSFPHGSGIRDLVWRMDVSGAPVRLAEYPHRQTRKGVMVQVNAGARKLVKSAFVATMRSGHEGVFQRVGRGRLPIRELFSSRVSDVFNDGPMIPGVLAQAQARFSSGFDRLLPLELAKIRR